MKPTINYAFLILLILSVSMVFEKPANSAVKLNSTYFLEPLFPNIKFHKPVAMIAHPIHDNIWYVVEQEGKIKQIKVTNNNVQNTSYIDITSKVDASKNESGLLSMAFHPEFSRNRHVYLSYTRRGEGKYPLESYISRFTGSKNGNSLRVDSELPVLRVNQPYSNHNGGHIAFDPDGKLLIGFGDGGAGGDPLKHAQNSQSLLGKLLRIDVDSGSPYGIPNDNPFANNKAFRPEIWAWGLRNPWRWSIDQQTGELWLADVGQNKWEEINLIEPGNNYGWNVWEGKHCYLSDTCGNLGMIAPVYEYSHRDGCSITGGYVYRGTEFDELRHNYIFADFCNGKIWRLVSSGNAQYSRELIIDSGLNIASFAQGNDNELYVIHHGGQIYKIKSKAN